MQLSFQLPILREEEKGEIIFARLCLWISTLREDSEDENRTCVQNRSKFNRDKKPDATGT